MKNLNKLITVENKLGVHARPSAMLVQLAIGFKSELFVRKIDDPVGSEVNAKSIMGVMMLAASYKTKLNFHAVGDDAEELLKAVENLFKTKFSEENKNV